MGRMMDALDINKAKYVQQENIIDIHNHMNRCNGCDNTSTCDDKLDNDTIDADTLDYCTNESTMKDLIEKHNNNS